MLQKLTPEEAEQVEWRFPMFGIPKKNKKHILMVIDYSKLNQLVKRIPCFVEPMHDLIISFGHWTWGLVVNSSMGCHSM